MIWNYIDVKTLEQYTSEKEIRHEICNMFEFSVSFEQQIDKLANEVFGGDKLPKICAHIRRSDFFDGAHPLLPTTEPFTSKALDYLATTVSRKKGQNKVSFLLLNDDVNFTNEVADQVKKNKYVKSIFTTKNFKPIDDMGLAIRYCDYFLLTSSGSTWIAYLIPDEKQSNVFYNSLFFKKNHTRLFKTFTEKHFVPPEWNRLVLDGNRIFVQDRSIPGIHI
ncbi:hypothetical protein M3Y97_01051000 [Aphelenchoides bicaudatus]|nr:hypothetical protein M3Y97_01051000 [Aphelenchoides bicaudatus]